MKIPDRDLRQRDILPPNVLAELDVDVIGVGAIGRQAALQLAAIGVGQLRLTDFDIVEPANLAAQGWLEADLGHLKVDAAARLCRAIHSGIRVHTNPNRWRRIDRAAPIVIVCVDSIDARRFIWDAVKTHTSLYLDARMAAESLRLLAVPLNDPAAVAAYPTTLFPAAEAHVGACTAKSTVYTANIAAGLMVNQLARWLRRLPTDFDATLNLLAGELSVANAAEAMGKPAAGAASMG